MTVCYGGTFNITRVLHTEIQAYPVTQRAKKASKPETFLPRVNSPWKVGAHVSAAGGIENAVVNAVSIGFVRLIGRSYLRCSSDTQGLMHLLSS